MFDLPLSLRVPGTPWAIVWTYSHYPKKAIKGITREQVLAFDFQTLCKRFEENLPTPNRRKSELTEKFSLFLTGKLLFGVVRLYDHRVTLVMEIAERAVERITATEELSLDEISEAEPRPLSPFDHDFDFNEETRANGLEDDMAEPSRFDQLIDNPEEPIQQQADENEQMEEPVPRPNRRTRKRTRKAVVESDVEDEDVPAKPKARRRRKEPAPNLARREDITMREEHIGEVERDLEELEPLNEQILSSADGHPVQLNDDTLLIINPGQRRQPSPIPFDDFGFDPINPPPDLFQQDRSLIRAPSVETVYPEDPLTAAFAHQSPPIQVRTQDPIHQDSTYGIAEQVRADTRGSFFPDEQISTAIPQSPVLPERLPSGIHSITLGTPERIRGSRGSTRGSFYPDDQISAAILRSPSIQVRLRSASPSRIIAVTMMATPPRSVDPSVCGSPIRGVFNADFARSSVPPVLPDAANSFDDFVFDVPGPDNGNTAVTKRIRPLFAKEPPIKLNNNTLLGRDHLYLKKNNRDKRRLRAVNQIAEIKEYYKKIFEESFVIEVNDELRGMIDSRANGSLVDEYVRRRETRSAEPVDLLHPSSRTSTLKSPLAAPIQLEQEQSNGADAFFNDVDNDFRPTTPVPENAPRTPVREFQTPVRQRARTPMDFDDYIPLPKVAEYLLSPPRAFPPDLLRSGRAFKEIGCKFDHDHLYMLLLYRCVKEQKVLFDFAEVAKKWPRAFVAKHFHNFLLLIQNRKIVAHTRNGRLQSFIMVPNASFKKNITNIAAYLER